MMPSTNRREIIPTEAWFEIRQSQIDAAQLEIKLRNQLDEPVPDELRTLAQAHAGQRVRVDL